jgi:hypothetical protein
MRLAKSKKRSTVKHTIFVAIRCVRSAFIIVGEKLSTVVFLETKPEV